MKWIKLSDKRPKDEEECLVAYHIMPGDKACGYAFDLATFTNFTFYSWELSRQLNYVTHWMPLPDAPKD